MVIINTIFYIHILDVWDHPVQHYLWATNKNKCIKEIAWERNIHTTQNGPYISHPDLSQSLGAKNKRKHKQIAFWCSVRAIQTSEGMIFVLILMPIFPTAV